MIGRHASSRASPLRVLLVVLVLVTGGGLAVAASSLGRADGPEGASEARNARVGGATEGGTSANPPVGTGGALRPRRGRLVIHGTGNVSLDTDHIPALRSNGYGWAWSGLEGLFVRDDLTVINLECPVTRAGAPVRNRPSYRCDPGALPAARRAGIDVANLANEHGEDRGPQGVLDSIRNLRAAGIAPVGAGRDGFAAERPAVFDIRGWRVAVLGFGAVLMPPNQTAGPGDTGTSTGHPLPHALRAIRAADRLADIVIVMIRWDVAGPTTRPRGSQVDDGHAMVDAGADVIFGHHSNRRDGSPRLHPFTIYRGSPIFWGLENLVWPGGSIGGSSTGVAEVTVMPEGRLRARLLPATIVSDGHPVLG